MFLMFSQKKKKKICGIFILNKRTKGMYTRYQVFLITFIKPKSQETLMSWKVNSHLNSQKKWSFWIRLILLNISQLQRTPQQNSLASQVIAATQSQSVMGLSPCAQENIIQIILVPKSWSALGEDYGKGTS